MAPDTPPPPPAHPSTLPHLKPYEHYLRTVRTTCSTPAGRAALRQGLAEQLASPWQLYMHLLPAGGFPEAAGSFPGVPETRAAEYPYLLIAALYAVHDAPNPRTSTQRTAVPARPVDGRRNLGWSYARAAAIGAMRPETAASNLSYVAQLDLDGLYRDLPAAVSLLRSQQVPVQWPVLLRDLTRWPRWAEDVRIEWARAFYTPTTTPAIEEISQ
ncbi:type I-E CRISPR-associated protein Cse2/CasB [Streptomyces sp. NPDC006733]|uniref:type I-E CRISPR-associated protein Cse2/CasB n=1 Tax=Streptomyces sp. NPDC006733 TaxID=3155460 RepID=UPI00340A17F0